MHFEVISRWTLLVARVRLKAENRRSLTFTCIQTVSVVIAATTYFIRHGSSLRACNVSQISDETFFCYKRSNIAWCAFTANCEKTSKWLNWLKFKQINLRSCRNFKTAILIIFVGGSPIFVILCRMTAPRSAPRHTPTANTQCGAVFLLRGTTAYLLFLPQYL
jgi:hypothetical protein